MTVDGIVVFSFQRETASTFPFGKELASGRESCEIDKREYRDSGDLEPGDSRYLEVQRFKV